MYTYLQGLSALTAPKAAAITLCIVYGLWLLLSLGLYVLLPRRKEPVVDVRSSTPSGSKNKLFELASRNSSFSSSCRNGSLHSMARGPQPLTKNIISEDKMIQLRKKSLDFVEAQKHRSLLDRELGLTRQSEYQNAIAEELEVKFKVGGGGGRRDSKPDQDDDDLDNSRIPLNPDTPDFEDCPFPPHLTIDSNQQAQLNSPSTDEEDTEHRSNYHGSADDELSPKSPKIPLSPSTLTRAHTFNYGDKPIMDDEEAEEVDDYDMEKGGSLRLTRHSKRARGKVNDIFSSFSSSALLISSAAHDDDMDHPAHPPPINVTSSTPPMQHMMVSVFPPEAPDNNQTDGAGQTPQPNSMQRRRKAALVPPIITGAQQHLDAPPPACPFHKSSLSPPRIGADSSREVSKSPKPIRRGISPTPSGDSLFDNTPNPPMRKKKVSVAHIEATVVPPTPDNLEPPRHLSLSRTSSYNTLRTHQDAFADNAFRSVMQISQDAIVCANSIGEIVFWSVGACKMFGYSPAEAVGSSLEVQLLSEKTRVTGSCLLCGLGKLKCIDNRCIVTQL